MSTEGSIFVIADTSVLVNFLCIDRIDLIARYPGRFAITDHVAAEITDHYPDQRARLDAALAAGSIEQLSVCGDVELDLFRQLNETHRLGLGESAAIAYACAHGYALAIDDRTAVKQARRLRPELVVLGTQDIMVQLIRDGAIEVDEADRIKHTWATEHRFLLAIASFSELL